MEIKTENDLRLEDEILEACSKVEKLVEAIREIGEHPVATGRRIFVRRGDMLAKRDAFAVRVGLKSFSGDWSF